MTHAPNHRRATGIPAIGLTIALALSTTTAPASARTFNINSAGSMVQQPLPPQWACALQQASNNGSPGFPCRESPVLKATTTRRNIVASQRSGASATVSKTIGRR